MAVANEGARTSMTIQRHHDKKYDGCCGQRCEKCTDGTASKCEEAFIQQQMGDEVNKVDDTKAFSIFFGDGRDNGSCVGG